jgi:hypothetical protein
MAARIEWDLLYAEYAGARAAALAARKRPKPFELPEDAAECLADPTADDVRWLTEALKDQERKWFVAEAAPRSESLAEVFFAPLLDAAIDEVDPSLNRAFIAPCVTAFGHRRVNEYLLDVVESGPDFHKAGAVNALYWAGAPLSLPGGDALADLWERKRRLLLETFVSNPSVDVRRSIIGKLDLDPADYPESHRPLVSRAIEIARGSGDEHIRHRVDVQLGNVKLFAPLPHRERGAGGT